jgi:hypothetical protein
MATTKKQQEPKPKTNGSKKVEVDVGSNTISMFIIGCILFYALNRKR